MDAEVLYAVHRYCWTLPAETITGWIERPHRRHPRLVGVSETPAFSDLRTSGDRMPLRLAMWIWPQPLLDCCPVQPEIGKPWWLLTTWTDNPGAQHRLSVIAVADDFASILHSWPGAAATVPLDSEWLTPVERSRLVLAAARL